MNIQYTINNNNDVITSINADFIKFGKGNSNNRFVPETWIGVTIFDCIDDDDTRMFHKLMLQKVRIRGETITYRYRCDSPSVARFMIMNIIPEKNAVRYENIIEDEVPIINSIHFEVYQESDVKRCSLCNRFKFKMGMEWLDAAHQSQIREASIILDVEYCVCNECRKKIR